MSKMPCVFREMIALNNIYNYCNFQFEKKMFFFIENIIFNCKINYNVINYIRINSCRSWCLITGFIFIFTFIFTFLGVYYLNFHGFFSVLFSFSLHFYFYFNNIFVNIIFSHLFSLL